MLSVYFYLSNNSRMLLRKLHPTWKKLGWKSIQDVLNWRHGRSLLTHLGWRSYSCLSTTSYLMKREVSVP